MRYVILGDAHLPTAADEITFQGDYTRDLIECTDYPMFDIDEVVKIFCAWTADKQENILLYRDKVYRFVMSGTLAEVHHTPWLRELDDSLDRYLSTPEVNDFEKMMERKTTHQSPEVPRR